MGDAGSPADEAISLVRVALLVIPGAKLGGGMSFALLGSTPVRILPTELMEEWGKGGVDRLVCLCICGDSDAMVSLAGDTVHCLENCRNQSGCPSVLLNDKVRGHHAHL